MSAYYEIRDWSKGIDTRRLPEATKAGALLMAVNCHVTRGGELEQRKAISEILQIPAGSKGLWVDANDRFHVWSIDAEPVGLDARVEWHTILHPEESTMTINRVLSVDDYYSVPYAVIEFEDGSVHHYYGEIRIREDGGLPPDSAAAVPPAFGNGRAYTDWFTLQISSLISPVASVDDVWLIAPADVNTPANWVKLNTSTVGYSTSSQQWAIDLAVEINTSETTPDVYCEAKDGQVRFSMKDIDSAYNGYLIQIDLVGDAAALPSKVLQLAQGLAPNDPQLPIVIPPVDCDYTMRAIYYLKSGVPTLAFRGPSVPNRPQWGDAVKVNGNQYSLFAYLGESSAHTGYYEFTIYPQVTDVGYEVDKVYPAYADFSTINMYYWLNQSSGYFAGLPVEPYQPTEDEEPEAPPGTPEFSWSPGRFAAAYGSKMYATSGATLNFSAIGNAQIWNPDYAGAGFIDCSIHSSGPKDLQSIAEYGTGELAVFAKRDIQVWRVDSDPALNTLRQTLKNAGTYAPRSVVPWGNDIAYLDRPGIRTLRMRDISNAAWINDIGVPIDSLVKYVASAAGEQIASRAVGAVDPDDGRFMLAINQVIFVLSFFPTNRIAAWTIYRPGFRVDEMVSGDAQVFMRSGDSVYALGGADGNEYDDCDVEAELPFLDLDDPGTHKTLMAIDVACDGVWKIEIALDHRNPTVRDDVATIGDSTFREYAVGLEGYTTHMALRFTRKAAGSARLGTVLIHYDKGDRL